MAYDAFDRRPVPAQGAFHIIDVVVHGIDRKTGWYIAMKIDQFAIRRLPHAHIVHFA